MNPEKSITLIPGHDSQPYGFVTSEAALRGQIFQRLMREQPLIGEGILYHGATILKVGSFIRLENNGARIIPHEFRVGPSGFYRLSHPDGYYEPEDFAHCNCKEVFNP